MNEINALMLEARLRAAFQRYLFSANGIAESEPELRDAFWEALGRKDVFARDPLLSAMPSYELGTTAAQLFSRSAPPHLHPGLSALAAGVFDTHRPLYSHQIASIERIQRGGNLIVASGTGSGKTECFLLPILDDALRNPGPGVRAIIVYPMNALANDQLHRLRLLLRNLPAISYGRYTGETAQSRKDMSSEDLADLGGSNERATRAEIRAEPPHILLTNFAMLEYLLLRPADADLFRHQRLQFVVLDEAHSYQGAQGIDVGFLMRRVTQAHPGCSLRHILTSATLGDDSSAVAAFGSALTGGSFQPADVIGGTRTTGFEPQRQSFPLAGYVKCVPDDAALASWMGALGDARRMKSLLEAAGFQVSATSDGDVGLLLFGTFRANAELAHLHEILSTGPSTVSEVAQKMWGQDDASARRVVHWLGLLGANAVHDAQSPPLVPVRHHLFFKGLQFGSVCLSRACRALAGHPSTRWSHFMLEDRQHCDSCDALALPLLTCVHCGLPVLRIFQPVGEIKWKRRAGPPNSSRAHLLAWQELANELDEESGAADAAPSLKARLCVSCGHFAMDAVGEAACSCPLSMQIELFVLNSTPEGDLRQCPNCRGESRKFASVLREFGTGEDAATAVIAESLLRELPPEHAGKPAGGRQLLVFSDSRQRAAYFAPFLQRTAGETQVMAPILNAIDSALKSNHDGAPFGEVASHFQKIAERQPFVIVRNSLDEEGEEFGVTVKSSGSLSAADRAQLRRDCHVALLRHFISQGRRRDTLPGLALAALAVDLTRDARDKLEPVASRLSVDLSRAEHLVQHLLGIIVRRRAIELPEYVTSRMLGPGPLQATMHRSDAGNLQGRTRIRWNAYKAVARLEDVVARSPQVAAVAAVLGVDPIKEARNVEEALEILWVWLRDYMLRIEIAPSEYVLPSDALTVIRPSRWLICQRCGATSAWSPSDRCLMPRCRGSLQPLAAQDEARWLRNHQRARFTESGPLPIQVREHTAQLTLQTGRSYQRKFMAGDVNVLSSSTTFEMGIDVGNLRATFLRNVPPTPANYIQRAGRAGRRREGTALSVTYARSVPHDQTHFYAAEAIAAGSVAIPRIRVQNARLGQRHVNSLILAQYLSNAGPKDDATTVGEFFVTPDLTSSPAMLLALWIDRRRAALEASVRGILPAALEITAQGALDAAASQMQILCSDVEAELQALTDREQQLLAAIGGPEPQRVARALEITRRLRTEFLAAHLIDFLASAHWLPSYAFPQDVVRLRVVEPAYMNTFRLERDAEYGIAEYAPGAEVVADGKLITSSAIDFKGRTPDIKYHRICRRCQNVAIDFDVSAPPYTCPVCGVAPSPVQARPRAFLVPRGFSSSLEKGVAEVRLRRVKPARTTEVFLVSGVAPAAFVAHPSLAGVSVGYRADGELFRANMGTDTRGFRVCLKCGLLVGRTGSHRTPFGIPCTGELKIVDLAHRFQTDTLQLRFNDVRPSPPPLSDVAFWMSFQTALLGAASDALKIPPRDLDSTCRAQDGNGRLGEVVIYDRVPGGAGYVQRIQNELPHILSAALQRVRSCPNPQCDVQASCYACLRSYYNQFFWDQLNRKVVVDWLEQALPTMRGK